MLSDMLEEVVKKDDPEADALYRKFRGLGLDRASDPNNFDALAEMIAYAQDLTSEQALSVMRIFSIALNLVNSAEVAHRLRVTRDHEMKADRNANVGPLPMLEDSMRGTIENILETGTGTVDEIVDKLTSEKVEIVLTAHPTEVNRRT